MSDALSLPPCPNLEQYKKLAKDFQRACQSHETAQLQRCFETWAETAARLEGGETIPRAARIAQRWRAFSKSYLPDSPCTLAGVQFFLAREHGFASWPKFARHIQALSRSNSAVSGFEQAADAIVHGEIQTLQTLLQNRPELTRERSLRQHRSTLLHYVSANGVEDFRQKTPPNIVEIATRLLDAGAGPNAVSESYGGSTTLGLVATSCHPEHAGVQVPLMELLLQRGAEIDSPNGKSLVLSCLRNGRGAAAGFLAKLGARLDLEAAAGVGRLDLVASSFGENRTLLPPATPEQMRDGFAWACQFGHTSIVDFLLQCGLEGDAKLRHHGQTGLHWAASGGHAETVKLLMDRGASVTATDDHYAGTPLGWALYAWANSVERNKKPSYYDVVARLVQAGSPVDPQWIEAEKDPRMRAALRGEP